jgi:SAM-dependent methyltransferase
MKFKTNFFYNYLKEAPIPLALERSFECEILSKQEFIHPILDIGCGEGLFTYILFDEKIDVGIDPDERELMRAKDYGMYNELLKCYGDNISKPSGSFQTILSNSVLEHIPGIESVLKEAHRLLADTGNFYVTVPTNLFDQYSIINQILVGLGLNNTAAKYRKFFNGFWRHYHYYDILGWQKLFEKNGFEVTQSQQYCKKKAALLNDFLAPFCIISFISKKLFNKWYLFKALRSIISPLYFALFNSQLINETNLNTGGIVFFHLKKITK